MTSFPHFNDLYHCTHMGVIVHLWRSRGNVPNLSLMWVLDTKLRSPGFFFGRNLYLIDPVCAPYDLFLKRQAEPLLSQPSRQLLGAEWRLGKRVRARLAASGRRLTLYPFAVCSQCLCVTTVCAAWQLRELRNLKYSHFERISVLFQALLEAGEEGVEV